MDVEDKAIIGIWKYGVPCFAMALNLTKSLMAGKAEHVTSEHVSGSRERHWKTKY